MHIEGIPSPALIMRLYLTGQYETMREAVHAAYHYRMYLMFANLN